MVSLNTLITNTLNSHNISFNYSYGEFCTPHFIINTNLGYIEDTYTGEILLETNNNDSLLDYLEIIPAIHSSLEITHKEMKEVL